jgi:hypothetical protein
MSEQNRIDQLEARISEMSKQIASLKEQQISGVMSEGLVTHIAGQIQMLFSNPAMLSSITSAILSNLQNALVFRAGQSKERAPQVLVLDYYVPGTQRVTLADDGTLSMEEQAKDADDINAEWAIDENFSTNHDAVEAIRDIMRSYNVEAGKPYYLIDDLSLQQYREDVSRKVREQTINREREMAIKEAGI